MAGVVIQDRNFCIRIDDKLKIAAKKEEDWPEDLKQKLKEITNTMKETEFSEKMVSKGHVRNQRNRARNIAIFLAATCAMAALNFKH